MKEGIYSKLAKVQQELVCPKNLYNNFGKYSYRSAEGIMESVKPLLAKYKLALTIADQVHEAGNYMYIESTVVLHDTESDERTAVTSQAGIDPNKKGQDLSQCFGSSSSYARKYALNGMFLIDDTKDADATNTHGKTEVAKTVTKKKATKAIKDAMAKAVADGKKEAVVKKMEDYELTEDDMKSILNPQL